MVHLHSITVYLDSPIHKLMTAAAMQGASLTITKQLGVQRPAQRHFCGVGGPRFEPPRVKGRPLYLLHCKSLKQGNIRRTDDFKILFA